MMNQIKNIHTCNHSRTQTALVPLCSWFNEKKLISNSTSRSKGHWEQGYFPGKYTQNVSALSASMLYVFYAILFGRRVRAGTDQWTQAKGVNHFRVLEHSSRHHDK